VRGTRTATFGGGGDAWSPGGGLVPRGVKVLLIANAAAYALQAFPGLLSYLDWAAGWNRAVVATFGLRPAEVLFGLRIWQPVTYAFLHGGLFHLLFNLLVLWMMGGEVERFWGRREFLRYYLVCVLGAAAMAFVFAFDGRVIGASGGVFGVMTAFALMFPRRLIYVWFVLPVPAWLLVLVLFAVELLVIGSRDGVAHFAHVGGALTGFLYLKLGLRDRLGWPALRGGGLPARWRRRRLRVEPGGAGGAAGPARRDEAAEIDRILDKISRTGLASLTPEESRTLEAASRRPRVH
jgi:membrane associated rhomboid family serine protease